MTDAQMCFTIERVEAFHLVVPDGNYWRDYRPDNRKKTARYLLKPGWRTVYGTRVESALVKVTLSDGSFGWGEATEPICPEVICRLVVELLWPLVDGVSFDSPAALWDFCYDLNRGRGHIAGYQLLAMAAVDIALWDALARRANVPVAALASKSPHSAVPVYLSGIRRSSVDERIEALHNYVSQGLSAAKIFVDSNIEATIAEVAALRQGVNGSWALMVDALWSYETHLEASQLRQALREFNVTWLECPLIPEDLDEHAALAANPGVPIALGEHFFTGHQSRPWIDAGVLDVFQPDIGRTGFSGGVLQARYAKGAGATVTPHMGTGSPIVQSAALQFWAACCGGAPCEYQLDMAPMLSDVFDSGWIYDHGHMALPTRVGFGVTVNEAELRRYCSVMEGSS